MGLTAMCTNQYYSHLEYWYLGILQFRILIGSQLSFSITVIFVVFKL